MGLYDTLFRPFRNVTDIQESNFVSRDEHLATVNELLEQKIELQESNGLLSLKLEDYMWSPINGWVQDRGFSLGTIQDEADHCRALYAINPLIKKAIMARVGMIHGKGNRIIPQEGGDNRSAIDGVLDVNRKKIFGPVARARLEAELSTAGNVWVIREQRKEAIVVPIYQIKGYVTEVEDPTKVLYWQRQYTTTRRNLETGQDESVDFNEYIPAYGNNSPAKVIGDVPVRTQARMIHIAANRQEGWVLGLPDVFAAKFWSRGHKEMFEAGHEFALAQGQIATKVTGSTGMGAQMAASRLADEPRRDPETGEPYNSYGGTFIGTGGMDIQLMGKMGSGVDFKSYDRIAGLIAAATGVPLSVLLAESDSEETSLENSVVEDMKLRQELWGEFYREFFGDLRVQVVWPRIKQETVYRVQQAVEIASRTNTLKDKEKRLLTLEAFGLEGDSEDTPDIYDHPDVQVYLAKKEIDLRYAPLLAQAEGDNEEDDQLQRSSTPDQGVDAGIGKLSDGVDAHDARDAGEQEHTR